MGPVGMVGFLKAFKAKTTHKDPSAEVWLVKEYLVKNLWRVSLPNILIIMVSFVVQFQK